ncbi:hypothetical protein ACF06X_14710 [Streptomyces sp. NPDC015346]|uniref:hypothetical protein n=1 Tax=Streptomyces sp. NPDC015346 TaxID=3364954 RepID=UPI0037030EDF
MRALHMVRELNGFFDGDIGPKIDEALAAPQATYPPTDWDAYHREQKLKTSA